MDSDRLHPQEAELAVLGGILYRNENFGKLTVTSDDFFFPKHRIVFRAIEELASKEIPIDVVTLEHELKRTPTWDFDGNLSEVVGGTAFLDQLELKCPDSASVQHYGNIVRQAASLRRLQLWAGALNSKVADGADLDTLQELRASAPDLLGASGTAPGTLADVQFDEFRPGLPSGIGIERFVPGGIPRDKVTCIFGDTGNFKSTVKNAVLFSLARAGHKCLDVSLEDPSSLTVARYLAQKHNIPYGRLATGQVEVPALDEYDREVLGRVVDGSGLPSKMVHIVAEARRQSVAAVFIDYIQLLDGCSAEHTELAEAVRLAQLSASRDKIAYVLVSQVKQDVRYRSTTKDKSGRPLGDPRATIRDTFGSAAVSTGAKLGLSVFRPWAYRAVPTDINGPVGRYCEWINNHTSAEWAQNKYERLLEVIVDKNVLGPAGSDAATVLLEVNPETGAIKEFAL